MSPLRRRLDATSARPPIAGCAAEASPNRLVIIGAGTGGLCLAHGLERAGIPVAVYERDRTRADGLQGYRVGIDPDGSHALHACLPPDLYETFVATCARTPRHFNMLTEQLREALSLGERPNTDPVNSEKSVSRMTLRQVLLTGLEDVVHFDKKFERYERNADAVGIRGKPTSSSFGAVASVRLRPPARRTRRHEGPVF